MKFLSVPGGCESGEASRGLSDLAAMRRFIESHQDELQADGAHSRSCCRSSGGEGAEARRRGCAVRYSRRLHFYS